MRRRSLYLFLSIPLVVLLAVGVYFLPPVHSRLAWRVEELLIYVKGVIDPPEKIEFVTGGEVAAAGPGTPAPAQVLITTVTATPTPGVPTETPAGTATPTPTVTLSPTPLPAALNLQGVRYMDQHGLWNYCAPANLAMALSYWGWPGDRMDTGEVLKPYDKDKNVMPYEMAAYVEAHTDLDVVTRVGGDFDLLKRFLAGGFPVLVEKGAYIKDFSGVVSWMGHYEVITGYDDGRGIFIAQDSYFTPDYEVPYDTFLQGWRSFNYTYLVVYPPDRTAEVMALLGPSADESENLRAAALKAADEIYGLSGVDQFFAWYNRGTNLKDLQDYAGAAAAYDEAFAIYNSLPEDKSVRPYRVLWYQTGPYFAYYYTGRYYDVISLATTAIDAALDEPSIEESFYWRAVAKSALGDSAGAADDFRQSLKYHPDFPPAVEQMRALGIEP
jgi:hypothetical protein